MLPSRRKPTHPGEILSKEFLGPLTLTPRQFADRLGQEWNEIKVEAIIKGKENISEKTAEQFAAALGTTAEFWKHLQNTHNQWEKEHRSNEKGSLKPWKKAQ
jgi:antitoxin HigA-1